MHTPSETAMVTMRTKYPARDFPEKSTRPFESNWIVEGARLFTMTAKIGLLALLVFCSVFSSVAQVQTGASQIQRYMPFLKGKRVGLVVNQTSMIGNTWLPDSLSKLGVNITCLFAPEHGIKGMAEAGKKVTDGQVFLGKKKVKVVSLYGKKKMPDSTDLKLVDVVIYDIQDVGVRFFTYISTLHYIMEALAGKPVKLIVLDRPNPNGYYVDGPVLDTAFRSFVGVDPIPIVYGLTSGELALMIKGESWIPRANDLDLQIIPCKQYDHLTPYTCPVAPSPNLRTPEAIYLYPSLGLFEGTDVSVGRGTDRPFEIIGKPGFEAGKITFIPKPIPGVSENPPFKGQVCQGFDLQMFCSHYLINSRQLYLYWLTGFYKASDSLHFFNPFFDKLAGTDKLRLQILQGVSEEDIHKSWHTDLSRYMVIRKRYLLYNDFY